MYEDHNITFTLRIPDGTGSMIIIRTWDDRWPRVDVEVKHRGKVIFPRGSLYCGAPRCGGWTSDGDRMRELVCDLVAMRPGDTDSDYFAGYSAEQLEWARAHSDTIRMVAMDRYGMEG